MTFFLAIFALLFSHIARYAPSEAPRNYLKNPSQIFRSYYLTITNEDDLSLGYVYVLKSHNAKLQDIPNVYKIGSTTNTVSERIRNAQNEPTYLYAGVDIIETYRCYNMHPRELEDRLHTFFDKVRLNINIPDERGVVISPREWFRVKLDVIGEAIDLILNRTINNFIYDPISEKIVAR